MSWATFQEGAYTLTEKEIAALSREILQQYTDARKAIEAQLKDVYAKVLAGVDPADYYNTMIKFNRLNNLLQQVTTEYRAFSKRAGFLTEQSLNLAMSNTYYRKLYTSAWLTDSFTLGVLPPNLIALSVTGTDEAWKNITRTIESNYGARSNYKSPYGTLSRMLQDNRNTELRKLRASITNGIIQGTTFTQLVKDITKITGVVGKDAVTGAKANILRILRTESNRVMNAASYAASKDLERQGVKVERMMLSVLDSQTRSQSASMDGQIVGVDEPFQYPGGVTAMYPGTTGVAKFDINDRETVVDVIDERSPKIRRGRNPETGKNEVFEFETFRPWAEKVGLKQNKYGQYVG